MSSRTADEPRVAIVTGAGRGLGRAIAEALAARGLVVVATDRDDGLLAWTEDAPAYDRYRAIRADVSDSTNVAELLRQVDAEFGALDVLVNNAGILTVTRSEELDDATWESILQVNVGGAIRMCRAGLPLLRRGRDASIVNISSITGSLGFPGRLAYAASKAAIESLSRTLAVEWGPLGVRVNAVAPGFCSTERAGMVHDSGAADPSQRAALTPLRRAGRPDEIGTTVAWLALDASFVNGQVVTVDGGFVVSAETAVTQRADTPDGA